MDDIDFAQSMKRSTSSSQRGRSVRRTDTSTVYGTAMSDSADGSVRVDLGGSIIGGDGMVGVTCPTTVTVRKGDTVLVQLVGARGTAQSPIVVGCVGRGDIQQGEINEAKEEADEAKTAAEQAKSSAKDAADAAAAAQQSAGDAADAAQDAIDEAGKATKAAGDAMDAATAAGTAASNAMSAATSAGAAATEANTAARGAVAGLGQVQDVLGTLDWIREHGTYALTEDTTVDPSKVYYVRSGTAPDYTYAPVAEPKDEELSTYYELSIDEALSEFVGAHLALLSDGLHVVSDASGYYIVLSNDDMKVYDQQNTLVATYGTTVQIGRSDESHVEMDFNSFKMVSKEGDAFFSADDLRDETGMATLTHISKGNGSTKIFFIPFIPDEFVSVTDSSHEGATYSTSYNYVTFDVAPDDGATVTIVYKTPSSDAKTYTLGKRMPGSAAGPMSIATGVGTTASGAYSHAEGHGTTARGVSSHAEGWDTTASSGYSHAEGYGTTSGTIAHAEGNNTTANGSFSHAEGDNTAARSGASHAEGTDTQAIGHSAHAEGRSTITANDYAHAEGEGTQAYGKAQHVEGRYNKKDLDGTYAHIIGNGTDDSHRSNAYTVDWDGNVSAAGDVADGIGTLDEVRRAAQPSAIVDLIYPVGSIYMSVNSTSPATLFGGTWQRITGRFLLAATDNGATGGNSTASVKAGGTGGEASHKLTSGESGVPAHNHGLKEIKTGNEVAGFGLNPSGSFENRPLVDSGGVWRYTEKNTAASASNAHNNMPPYLAVYIWKRTA